MANPPIRSFTDLIVWQKAHKLYLDAQQDMKEMSTSGRGTRELADQLLRSVGSIAANIAEGFGSDGPLEYCRYLSIARKSAAEAQNWFLTAGDSGAISTKEPRVKTCEEILKMLYSLREKLKARAAGPVDVEKFNSNRGRGYFPRGR